MTIIEAAIAWAEETAGDNSHGYSQTTRWGPSYDCSSFVITAYQRAMAEAGMKGPKDYGATYTGNMRTAFKSCGFSELEGSAVMQRGDILLTDPYGADAHTVLYLGSGKIVHARSAEDPADTADNSGNEIRIQPLYGSWDYILRYTGGDAKTGDKNNTDEKESPMEDTYTVKAGDTLFKIAASMLGDGRKYKDIMELNGLESSTIYPGQVLKLRA